MRYNINIIEFCSFGAVKGFLRWGFSPVLYAIGDFHMFTVIFTIMILSNTVLSLLDMCIIMIRYFHRFVIVAKMQIADIVIHLFWHVNCCIIKQINQKLLWVDRKTGCALIDKLQGS